MAPFSHYYVPSLINTQHNQIQDLTNNKYLYPSIVKDNNISHYHIIQKNL